MGKRRRQDRKRSQRAESKRQEKIREHPAWKVQAMEELTKDRKYLIEQNWDTIRDVATQAEARGCPVGPGKAPIVCVVDDAYGLGQHYGTEAGEHMLAWRRSRGEHALMWTVVGWDDIAGAIPGSRSWSQFRAMTEDVERESPGKYLAVCLINGADGVGVGYGYSLVPREPGEVAGNVYLQYQNETGEYKGQFTPSNPPGTVQYKVVDRTLYIIDNTGGGK